MNQTKTNLIYYYALILHINGISSLVVILFVFNNKEIISYKRLMVQDHFFNNECFPISEYYLECRFLYIIFLIVPKTRRILICEYYGWTTCGATPTFGRKN